MRNKNFLIIKIFTLCFFVSLLSCAKQASQENDSPDNKKPLNRLVKDIKPEDSKIAGELFGIPVPLGNYYFAKRVVMTFSAPWRGTPKTQDELEDLVWQELLFSFEAFRRGIEASQEEIDEEIDKMLKADKVSFDRKTDSKAYEKWVRERLNEPVDLFENQMEHLVKLHKLRQQIIDSIEPQVSQEEAYDKFLDEYNTLLVELAQFDDLKKAREFYEQILKPLPRDALDKLIWDDLVLSYEAYKRGIEVDKEELEGTITKFTRENEANFIWNKNEEAYKNWLEENIGFKEDIFRQYIEGFLKIDKLTQKIYKSEQPQIKQEEYSSFLKKNRSIARAYGRFSGEFNVSSKDFMVFGSLKEAENIYQKLKREPGPWDEKRRKSPELFKRPGFVALDFLINIWGFKRDDAYKMMECKIGDFYPPSEIYKNYAVFKILKKRVAEPDKFKGREDYYRDRVKMIKKMEGYKEWVDKFKKAADIKVYLDKEK